MTKSSFIEGESGKIEVLLEELENAKGTAIIAHPHPLYCGNMTNKVISTIATTLHKLKITTLRFNFRGVGKSEGLYDYGIGECQDFIFLADWLKNQYPDLPIYACGFSFGALIAANANLQAPDINFKQLIMVGMAIRDEQDNLNTKVNPLPTAPTNSIIIHGDLDTTINILNVQKWAGAQNINVNVVGGAEHFFHGRLQDIKTIINNKINY